MWPKEAREDYLYIEYLYSKLLELKKAQFQLSIVRSRIKKLLLAQNTKVLRDSLSHSDKEILETNTQIRNLVHKIENQMIVQLKSKLPFNF